VGFKRSVIQLTVKPLMLIILGIFALKGTLLLVKTAKLLIHVYADSEKVYIMVIWEGRKLIYLAIPKPLIIATALWLTYFGCVC